MNGRRESLGPFQEHSGEVLPGVIPAREEQRDPLPLPRRRHDAGGEQSRALPRARRSLTTPWLRVFDLPLRGLRTRPRQRQDLDAGVIVVKDLAWGRLTDRLFESRPNHFRHFRHDFALRRGRQRNPQARLQPLQPIPRNATAVLQQCDHRRRAGIILFLAHLGRRFRLVNLAAQIAAQTFELIDRRRNRRLAHHSDAQPGVFLRVHLSLQTFRTVISGLQSTMRDFDSLRAPIRRGAVSPVPRLGWGLRPGKRMILWRDLDPRLLQHLARLLRARLGQPRAQTAEGRVLVADLLDQMSQRPARPLQSLAIRFAQRLSLARSLYELSQLFEVHFDHLVSGVPPFAPLRAGPFTRLTTRFIRLPAAHENAA